MPAPSNSDRDPESPVDPRPIVQNIDLAPAAMVLSAIVLSIIGLITVAVLVSRHVQSERPPVDTQQVRQ